MSSDNSYQLELPALLGRLFDEKLSSEEAARLEAILLESPQARDVYLDAIALHVHLDLNHALNEREVNDVLQGALSAESARPNLARRMWKTSARYFAQVTPMSMLVAALVISVMLAGMAVVMPPIHRAMSGKRDKHLKVVAKLTALHEAKWVDDEHGFSHGRHLLEGNQLHLKSGIVEVTFGQGAVVTLQGPVYFQVDSRSAGTLHQGKLFARVGPQAVGFVIHTPSAKITDLGTEFGVEVFRRGKELVSDVEVFRGLVECRAENNRKSVANVVAGERYLMATSWRRFAKAHRGNHFVTFCPETGAPSGAIAFTNFDGAVIDGNSLRNLPWKTKGLHSPGDLVAFDEMNSGKLEGLFSTVTALGRFAPKLNLHTAGPWSVTLPIEPNDDEVELSGVRFEYLQLRASGEAQSVPRDTDYLLTLTGAKSGLLASAASIDRDDVSGVVRLRFPKAVHLHREESYSLKLVASGTGLGTHTSIDNLSILGRVLVTGPVSH